MKILNIAAGKFAPLPLPMSNESLLIPKFIVNIDTSYYSSLDAEEVENEIDLWETDADAINQTRYLNYDIFNFMEQTRIKFNRVALYRFLEHVSFTNVEYFIYLISTILERGSLVDVIVPNYEILAEMILNENTRPFKEFNFQAHNILLTTELLNEPSCPHASIWTKDRMKHFWELEGRFEVVSQNPAFLFDGRDIYLRAIMERL